jgi:hypothetical protein
VSVILSGVTAAGMAGEAVLSEDGAYRYGLTRRWDPSLVPLPWIMLNPSTADEKTDDVTITRCCARALRAGYGGIDVLNLFALRSADPGELLRHPDPAGPENDEWLARLATGTPRRYRAVPVAVAWGALGVPLLRDRAAGVLAMLDGCRLLCLGTTKDGYPRHPCRLGYDVPLVPFPCETGNQPAAGDGAGKLVSVTNDLEDPVPRKAAADVVAEIETELDRLDPPPSQPEPPAPEQPRRVRIPSRRKGLIEAATAFELKMMPEALRKGAVAAAALRLARELDGPLPMTPRDTAGHARELRMCMTLLAEQAPGERKGDTTDEVRARREARMAEGA